MAKPNYAFAKRQRELEKKKKTEEKRLRKAAGLPDEPEAPGGEPAEGGVPDTAGSEPTQAVGARPAE